MNSSTERAFSYQEAGVNIDAGNRLVENIKNIAKRTQRPEVLKGIGGFAALFEVPVDRYKKPILVSSTDGVGTKLKLAIELNKYDTIGIDLVAMCVNDIIVTGAEPLFFLDYYATGKLDETIGTQIISGIANGCIQANAALIGGETAEMPRLYHDKDYDLAGFCVGVAEKDHIIDGQHVKSGNALIGVASSGIHSNGYALVHHILNQKNIALDSKFEQTTLGETLLTPTKIYIKPILDLLQKLKVHAIAHITGGGIVENLPRVLPNNCKAIINKKTWSMPPIFSWLQQHGSIAEIEMYRTFNCGVGLVLCIAEQDVTQCLEILKQHGEQAWLIGHIENKNSDESTISLI